MTLEERRAFADRVIAASNGSSIDEAQVSICQEIIDLLSKMKGKDLSPYLREVMFIRVSRKLRITLEI